MTMRYRAKRADDGALREHMKTIAHERRRFAYAFLQNRRLRQASGGKRIPGPPLQPSLPAIRQAILDQIFTLETLRCPRCRARLRHKMPK